MRLFIFFFIFLFTKELSAEIINAHWKNQSSSLWTDWRMWSNKTIPNNSVDLQYHVHIDMFEFEECKPCYEVIVTNNMDISVESITIETGIFTGSTSTINSNVINNSILRPGWYRGELDSYPIPPVPGNSLGNNVPEPSISCFVFFLLFSKELHVKRTIR